MLPSLGTTWCFVVFWLFSLLRVLLGSDFHLLAEPWMGGLSQYPVRAKWELWAYLALLSEPPTIPACPCTGGFYVDGWISSYPFFPDWVSFPMALAIWNSGSLTATFINWGAIDPWLWGIWILLYFVLLVHKCWLHQCRDFWCFWRRWGRSQLLCEVFGMRLSGAIEDASFLANGVDRDHQRTTMFAYVSL